MSPVVHRFYHPSLAGIQSSGFDPNALDWNVLYQDFIFSVVIPVSDRERWRKMTQSERTLLILQFWKGLKIIESQIPNKAAVYGVDISLFGMKDLFGPETSIELNPALSFLPWKWFQFIRESGIPGSEGESNRTLRVLTLRIQEITQAKQAPVESVMHNAYLWALMQMSTGDWKLPGGAKMPRSVNYKEWVNDCKQNKTSLGWLISPEDTIYGATSSEPISTITNRAGRSVGEVTRENLGSKQFWNGAKHVLLVGGSLYVLSQGISLAKQILPKK